MTAGYVGNSIMEKELGHLNGDPILLMMLVFFDFFRLRRCFMDCYIRVVGR